MCVRCSGVSHRTCRDSLRLQSEFLNFACCPQKYRRDFYHFNNFQRTTDGRSACLGIAFMSFKFFLGTWV